MTDRVTMAHVPNVTLIRGDFSCGKTTQLVKEVRTLLAGGAAPQDVVVFCASPTAAADFAARLQAAFGEDAAATAAAAAAAAAAKVRVTVPREYFLGVLAAPAAQAVTGRDARLLNNFEYDFLLEDLKTSTIPPKRLGEMMKFFNRQLYELRDFEEDWLYSVEEQDLYNLLQNCLGFTRGIIASEVGGLAVRVAREGALPRVPYVLVDDFRALSRGSQVAATLLASEHLWVTDAPGAPLPAFEEYPYADGIDELEEENPDWEVVELGTAHCSRAGFAAADALLHEAALPVVTPDELNVAGWDVAAAQAAKGIKDVALPVFGGAGKAKVEHLAFDLPEEEFRGVAAYVAERLAEGYAPGDVVVAATHRTWQRNIKVALGAAGIATSELTSGKPFVGDIRTFDGCDAQQVYTALALLANPTDGVAWRSWLGFGDYLTNSNGMILLRDRAAMGGRAIDAALEMLSVLVEHASLSEGKQSCERMQEAVERCRGLFEACADKCGRDLMEAVCAYVLGEGAKIPPAITRLMGPIGGKDQSLVDAKVFVDRANRRVHFPVADAQAQTQTQAVRVVPYDQLIGLSPKVLVICGFVNGFMPKHDYFDRTEITQEKHEKRRAEDLSRAVQVFTSATERVAVSTFAKVDMEVATRSRIVMDRIGLVDGVRMAYAQPSILMEYL